MRGASVGAPRQTMCPRPQKLQHRMARLVHPHDLASKCVKIPLPLLTKVAPSPAPRAHLATPLPLCGLRVGASLVRHTTHMTMVNITITTTTTTTLYFMLGVHPRIHLAHNPACLRSPTLSCAPAPRCRRQTRLARILRLSFFSLVSRAIWTSRTNTSMSTSGDDSLVPGFMLMPPCLARGVHTRCL